MKSFLTFLKAFLFIALFNIPQAVNAQFVEGFEQGSKSSYSTETDLVEFESGEWLLEDALIGRSDGDRYNGSQSIRIRDGFIEMQFNYSEGANRFSFFGANAGFTNDTGGAVQVSFSIDDGMNWVEAGDEITLTEENELVYYEIDLDINEPVRFRIEKTSGNRINIDDVVIEPYQELSENSQLVIRFENRDVNNSDTLSLPATNIPANSSISLSVSNNGQDDLIITSAEWQQGDTFFLSDDIAGSYTSSTSKEVEVSLQSNESGEFTDQLQLVTNDPDFPEFILDFNSLVINENKLITISKARELPFGVRVTVGGIVTVADEFMGPGFIEDGTSGIAFSIPGVYEQIQRGDSVLVNGPLSEFNPIEGNRGKFLKQIGEFQGDADLNLNIVNTDRPEPDSKIISVNDMRSGNYESQLVTVQHAVIQSNGEFTSGDIYPISDRTGGGEMHINSSLTEFDDTSIYENPVYITGIVDLFNGEYRINPRELQDIEEQEIEYEGEEISIDETFDVVTWNIEWFGSQSLGPVNTPLQMKNVLTVIRTIDADLYAFQEIANPTTFNALTDSLEQYRGFLADYSQNQKTAYLYKSAVVDSLDSGLLSEAQSDYNWAGRLPLYFEFDATIDGKVQRIFSYNLHTKAFGDQSSYTRRRESAISLKTYLDRSRSDSNVIIMGDFNDQLNYSTYNEVESPYTVFLEDDSYYAITKSLEDLGFTSYRSGEFRSFIDHMIIKNSLMEYHIDGSQRVHNVDYISDFTSTTSDHAPVYTRFQFTESQELPVEIPESFTVEPNYPNPFNPSTTIRFSIPESDEVSITIFDVLGRNVANLVRNQTFSEGAHMIPFDAGDLSSGVYIYSISVSSGQTITEKMMLIK